MPYIESSNNRASILLGIGAEWPEDSLFQTQVICPCGETLLVFTKKAGRSVCHIEVGRWVAFAKIHAGHKDPDEEWQTKIVRKRYPNETG